MRTHALSNLGRFFACRRFASCEQVDYLNQVFVLDKKLVVFAFRFHPTFLGFLVEKFRDFLRVTGEADDIQEECFESFSSSRRGWR